MDAGGKFHIEPEYWGPKDYRIMVNKSIVIWPIAYIHYLGSTWGSLEDNIITVVYQPY